MKFQDKLKQLRTEKDLTQEELAKEICVSRTLITKYETGVTQPTKENLQAIAVFFKVEAVDLIDDDDTAIAKSKTSIILEAIASGFIAIINLLFIVIAWSPIIPKKGYMYPPGGGEPDWIELYKTNVVTATLKMDNPIGIITFISCAINVLLTMGIVFKIVPEKYNKVKITNYIIFALNIILIALTFIIAVANIDTKPNL